jgi:hypothetical protein
MKAEEVTGKDSCVVWKMIYLARRNPALRPEEFAQAWREHSALGRQCRNVGQRVKAGPSAHATYRQMPQS